MAKNKRCANGTLMTREIKTETMKYHFSPNKQPLKRLWFAFFVEGN